MDMNWSEPKIIAVQTILFWVAHTKYVFAEPLSFWVIVPIASVILGIIAWRCRSITPSTIAHILMNLLWSLIRVQN
jgi:membrane protease YdiL (CAAX protease family)